MINKILSEKFPFVSKYFETLILNNPDKFPQSIVFEGLDTFAQYNFTMELARILNCIGDRSKDCTCINCSWIKDVKHPAVNILSPINFKSDGDTSKTVISVTQAKKITSGLSESSDYHRFFIFCDAKIKQRSEKEKALMNRYKEAGFNFPEENWTPYPLNMKVFKAEASNSLLKSIEEPPKNVTFVFLTKSKEDIISTIVSRSVTFKLANKISRPANADIQNKIRNYPYQSLKEALETAYAIDSDLKAEEKDVFDFLDEFQEYILSLIKLNNGNALQQKRHIDLIERAKNRLKASMNRKVVLESLFIDLVQR